MVDVDLAAEPVDLVDAAQMVMDDVDLNGVTNDDESPTTPTGKHIRVDVSKNFRLLAVSCIILHLPHNNLSLRVRVR
jgi:hypothetical protein